MKNEKTVVGIIGGSGLGNLAGLLKTERQIITNEYGQPSAPLIEGDVQGMPYLFLARHGSNHGIPPHLINYRANIKALHDRGVKKIIAFGAVGSMHAQMKPGSLVVPDQLIDYSWGREQTFFTGSVMGGVKHIDFTEPFDESMRQQAVAVANSSAIDLTPHGCYAVTQGPRLETTAEINKYARDGAHLVGMTAMPEAALARELNIPYLLIALVVNWAAGRENTPIHDQLARNMDKAVAQATALLPGLLKAFISG